MRIKLVNTTHNFGLILITLVNLNVRHISLTNMYKLIKFENTYVCTYFADNEKSTIPFRNNKLEITILIKILIIFIRAAGYYYHLQK